MQKFITLNIQAAGRDTTVPCSLDIAGIFVITQEDGFSTIIPTRGSGVYTFTETREEILALIKEVS